MLHLAGVRIFPLYKGCSPANSFVLTEHLIKRAATSIPSLLNSCMAPPITCSAACSMLGQNSEQLLHSKGSRSNLFNQDGQRAGFLGVIQRASYTLVTSHTPCTSLNSVSCTAACSGCTELQALVQLYCQLLNVGRWCGICRAEHPLSSVRWRATPPPTKKHIGRRSPYHGSPSVCHSRCCCRVSTLHLTVLSL